MALVLVPSNKRRGPFYKAFHRTSDPAVVATAAGTTWRVGQTQTSVGEPDFNGNGFCAYEVPSAAFAVLHKHYDPEKDVLAVVALHGLTTTDGVCTVASACRLVRVCSEEEKASLVVGRLSLHWVFGKMMTVLDGRPHSFDDAPAVVDPEGKCEGWYCHGTMHRDGNNPAALYVHNCLLCRFYGVRTALFCTYGKATRIEHPPECVTQLPFCGLAYSN